MTNFKKRNKYLSESEYLKYLKDLGQENWKKEYINEFIVPWWEKYNLVCVVGFYHNYRQFVRKHDISPHKARFIDTPEKLRGVRDVVIVLLDEIPHYKEFQGIMEHVIHLKTSGRAVVTDEQFQKPKEIQEDALGL